MKTLILHIGWPKSGTSSIQGLLAHNSDQLSQFGFLYPAIERMGDAHHPACGLLIDHQDPLIPPPKNSLEYLIDYLEAPERDHIHTVILSSEGFCRAKSIKKEFSLLTRKMEVKVVACLRDPIVWANSLMNQLIKMSLFFDSAVNLEALAEEMILRDFRYSNRLQLWSDVVGKENMKVIALEEGEDFAAAFFDVLGIKDHMLPNAPPHDSTNKSLSLGSLQIIHWMFRQNLALDHSRRVVLNQRFHKYSKIAESNLLSTNIFGEIKSKRDEVTESLSRLYLEQTECFFGEIPKLKHGDFKSLNSPDIIEISEKVLIDDPKLILKLKKEIKFI